MTEQSPILEFCGLRLDQSRGLLLRGSEVVPLRAKSFALLTYLVKHRDRVIAREELFAAIWDSVAITDDALTQTVRDVRRVLGDAECRVLKSVPKRGYIFEPDDAATGDKVSPAEPAGRTVPAAPSTPLASTKPDFDPGTKISIAVLPFSSFEDRSDQAGFAVGLMEDLITNLSRQPGFFVIAKNSSLAVRDIVDVREVGQRLGVRYVVTGSARRADNRVRISAQLIDTLTSGHVWADRFDRALEDIFAVRDEVTSKIVEALRGRLTPLPARNRPRDLAAYDLCVRARGKIGLSPQAAREGRVLAERAIELDPQYAEAHRWLAFLLWSSWAHWFLPEPTRDLSVFHARRATELDPNDAGCRWVLAHVLNYEREWDTSDRLYAEALRIDPNHADAWALLAEKTIYAGDVEGATHQIGLAMRLSPTENIWARWVLGLVQYVAGDYEAAIATLSDEAVQETGARRILAASLAQIGDASSARLHTALFMASNPNFTIRRWLETQPIRRPSIAEHFAEGYRKAGLPFD